MAKRGKGSKEGKRKKQKGKSGKKNKYPAVRDIKIVCPNPECKRTIWRGARKCPCGAKFEPIE